MCGNACTGLRNLVFQVAVFAEQNQIAPPDVPVSVTTDCSGDGG
jgi:hypothetical protein